MPKMNKVIQKNKIDTKIQKTEDLVKKMLNIPGKKPEFMDKRKSRDKQIADLDEDALMESLDNIDLLLEQVQGKPGDFEKGKILLDLKEKYGIKQP